MTQEDYNRLAEVADGVYTEACRLRAELLDARTQAALDRHTADLLRARVAELEAERDQLRALHAAACDRVAAQSEILARAALRAERGHPLLGRPEVEIDYANHVGERRVRRIRPLRLWYGATDWHAAQYLLAAEDCETGRVKDFALAGIRGWRQVEEPNGCSATAAPTPRAPNLPGQATDAAHLRTA